MSKANSIFQKWRNKAAKAEKDTQLEIKENINSFPLSKEQMRLWVLSQMYPKSPVYNFILAYSFGGDIHLEKLTQAIATVLGKHDVLNTAISVENTSAKHQIRTEPIPLHTKQIEAKNLETARALALEEAKAFGLKPFELNKALVRAQVLELNKTEYWFIFVAQHLVFDKQSVDILKQDLLTEYNNLSGGEESQLTEPHLSFAEYTLEQRNDNPPEETIAFWKEKFLTVPEPIAWPFEENLNRSQQFSGGYLKIEIQQQFVQQLTALAQKEHTSLFVVLLTLYQSFLALYLDSTDICVGVPVTNRMDEKWQNTIGFFDNTLALRSTIDLKSSFIECIQQVKREVSSAMDHRSMPFQDLVKLVSPERSNLNPLFQTMLIYHESIPKENNPITVKEHRIDLGVSKFDLSLYCQKNGEELEMIFETSNRVFSDQSKLELRLAFETFVEKLQGNWESPLGKFHLLDNGQASQCLEEWSFGGEALIAEKSIAQLFASQLNKNPNNSAVSDGEVELTYDQLDKKINKLSLSLQNAGIREGSIVAIYLERSIAAVVAIYALHRIGASYVPIDPSYPEGRTSLMMEESGAIGVITDKENTDSLGHINSVLILNPESEEVTSANNLPSHGIEFHNGAYVLFTSGSTGRPKGVQITQANLVHSTKNRFSFYNEIPQRFLLLPSFSFDSSVAGLFWPLCSGGSLHVPPHGIEHDIEALSSFIADFKITSTLILPSLYAVLLEQSKDAQLESLQLVIVAGEAATTKLVDAHYNTLPNCKLYNEYGPTEASVWSSACLLKKEDIQVPIGKPLKNTYTFVLNSALQPVLPGHVGELYIGGLGVSKGYLNRPEANETSFIKSPFDSKERLYKTGDLARFDKNGDLFFVGRKDQQIKINGKRVELAEINTSILALAGVKQAHVLHQEIKEYTDKVSEDIDADSFFSKDPSSSEELLRQIQTYSQDELNTLFINLNA